MGLHHGFDQTQAQSESFLIPAFVAAVKAVPNTGKVFGGNARTGVADRDDCLMVLSAGSDLYLPALPGVFDRVVQQVREGLLDAITIGLDLERVGQRRVETDLFVFGND